ncbi:unnamed protein product [Peniophora sp. CBMAI 1063]|nr:unnamed protein product [Peniophora sp. CBMAI 1063]
MDACVSVGSTSDCQHQFEGPLVLPPDLLRNKLSIQSLPAELLSEILVHAAALDPPHPPKRTVRVEIDGDDAAYGPDDTRTIEAEGDVGQAGNKGFSSLSREVCRYWETLAVKHTPIMWANEVGKHPEGLATVISRAGQCPLTLTLHGASDRVDIAPVFDYLINHPDVSRRVKRIFIYEHRRNAFTRRWLASIRQCAFENVCEIQIVAYESEPFTADGTPLPFPQLQGLTSLKSVVLTDIGLQFPDSCLSTLTMNARDPDYDYQPAYSLEIYTLLSSLEHSPSTLVELHIDFPELFEEDESPIGPPTERVRLDNLRILRYTDRSPKSDMTNSETVTRFIDQVSYGSKTKVSLYLVFEDLESIRSVSSIIHALYGAGTPNAFGVQILSSAHDELLTLALYPMPEGKLAEAAKDKPNEIETFLDAIFEPDQEGNARHICDIGIQYLEGLSAHSVVQEALHDIEVHALQVVSSDIDTYTGILVSLPEDTPSRWIEVGEDEL